MGLGPQNFRISSKPEFRNKKGINIKDRSAAHDHRLKLGNLRVLGMRVATAIAYW